jgi:hypothetical protein
VDIDDDIVLRAARVVELLPEHLLRAAVLTERRREQGQPPRL